MARYFVFQHRARLELDLTSLLVDIEATKLEERRGAIFAQLLCPDVDDLFCDGLDVNAAQSLPRRRVLGHRSQMLEQLHFLHDVILLAFLPRKKFQWPMGFIWCSKTTLF